jgi:hypothetical protein
MTEPKKLLIQRGIRLREEIYDGVPCIAFEIDDRGERKRRPEFFMALFAVFLSLGAIVMAGLK